MSMDVETWTCAFRNGLRAGDGITHCGSRTAAAAATRYVEGVEGSDCGTFCRLDALECEIVRVGVRRVVVEQHSMIL